MFNLKLDVTSLVLIVLAIFGVATAATVIVPRVSEALDAVADLQRADQRAEARLKVAQTQAQVLAANLEISRTVALNRSQAELTAANAAAEERLLKAKAELAIAQADAARIIQNAQTNHEVALIAANQSWVPWATFGASLAVAGLGATATGIRLIAARAAFLKDEAATRQRAIELYQLNGGAVAFLPSGEMRVQYAQAPSVPVSVPRTPALPGA